MTESVPAPQGELNPLVAILDLEQVEQNIFRGQSRKTSWLRAFGGQVAAQALIAAGRTVESERRVHSLHSYFLRPGDSTRPIVYMVERSHDGRSFSTRRVTGVQGGQVIFTLSASFHVDEQGLEHQVPAPVNVPPAEQLPTLAERLARAADVPRSRYAQDNSREIELRWVDDPDDLGQPGQADERSPGQGRAVVGRDRQLVWMRAPGRVPDDPLLHICLLTYASDMTLLQAVLARHGLRMGQGVASMASLDHAIWFRGPVRADEWFLYETTSPFAAGARGLASGQFFDQQGHHLASVMQEGLVRLH